MLGYMTASEALREGFTHHGHYFGIPCWVGGIDSPYNGLKVATKWAPLEYLMTAFHYIEINLRLVMFPDEEPMFQFAVGRRIET